MLRRCVRVARFVGFMLSPYFGGLCSNSLDPHAIECAKEGLRLHNLFEESEAQTAPRLRIAFSASSDLHHG